MSSLISDVQTMLMLIFPHPSKLKPHCLKLNPGWKANKNREAEKVPSQVLWPFSYLRVGVGTGRRLRCLVRRCGVGREISE